MIYIGTDEGIYRWYGGSGWPVFHALQDRSIVALASPGPGVLTALDRSGAVLETTDNGFHWRTLPLPASAGRGMGLAIAGSPPSVIVAVKPAALFTRPIGAPVPKAPPIRPSGGRLHTRVYHGGLELAGKATALVAPHKVKPAPDFDTLRLCGWTPLAAPEAPRTTLAHEIRAIATDSTAFYAAVTGSGIWTSKDAGKGWSQSHGLPSEVHAIRPVPGKPGLVWAATDDGAWFSADSGATWEDRSVGMEGYRHLRAIEVHPGSPDIVLCGASPRSSTEGAVGRQGIDSALFETANSGKAWTRVKKSFPERFEYDTIADIRFDPSAPENALVALGSGELWITRNEGAYWCPIARQTKAARTVCATM